LVYFKKYTLKDIYLFIKYVERFTRKRTLENQDELILTNMTRDEGNLPTKLPTILKWDKLNPRLNLLDKNLNLYRYIYLPEKVI